MTTHRTAGEGSSSRRWTGLVACALPLFLLLVVFAFGVVIPLWIYLLVLLWCLLMPFGMGRRNEEAAQDSPGHGSGDHGGGGVGPPEHDREEVAGVARRLAERIPSDVFEFRGWETQPAGVVLRGKLLTTPGAVQEVVGQTARTVLGRSPQVMVHQDEDGEPYVLILSAAVDRTLAEAVPRRRPWVNLGLLVATLATTIYAGATHQGINLVEQPGAWTRGLSYALGLMLILGVHEMGHYLTARRHGVQVSLPYFIPIPFALGTFGAFISMPPLLKNRRQLFDIGVAGPLAGLAVAIPALMLGLQRSQVLPVDTNSGGHMSYGVSVNASVMLAFFSKLSIADRLTEGHYIVFDPLAFAGWLGLMITALNLLPVGQLDGGHVAYALFGRTRAGWIGKVALFGMVLLGLFVWSGLLFWALLVFFIAGRRGIPPMDDVTTLDANRRAVGWFAFALLAFILLPVPHALSPALGLHCPYL